MRYADFKEHKIVRSCKGNYDKPSRYKKVLAADFGNRCCYCNMHRSLITSPFHVEHFIPVKVFKGKKDSLWTDYENLMWSCPKCNLSKGDKYEGDFPNQEGIINELFYNPVTTDYNEIFYRNEYGGIDSDDPKGREMIKLLKLYRPIHNLSWLVEKLEKLDRIVDAKLEKETDEEKRALLMHISNNLGKTYMKKEQAFRAAYNGNIFPEQDEDSELKG